jgi:hypothetical protein
MKHIGLEDSSMKLFGQSLAALFSLALLGALGVGGYFALKFSAELFGSMDFQVAAVTTIASVVALLVAWAIASSIRQASKQNTANQLYAEKAMAYQRFIDIWEGLFRHGRDSKGRDPNELSEELLALDHHLILYGGSSVVKAHVALRALERESGAQHPDTRSQFAKALIEIRNDIGSGTHDLTAEELQRLFFANSDRVRASTTASAYQDLQPRVSLASNS